VRRGFDAPTLVQNVFSIVAFSLLFLLIFSWEFPNANLGALFTTSAIFGEFTGLALQDTLEISLLEYHSRRIDLFRPAIITGAQRHTGVVEEITWRAINRTFQNHVVLINNSSAARNPLRFVREII
jgi:hypothetical protein